MPNTTPIPELIALELVERLEAITVLNGYQFNVSEVERPTRKGDNWKYKHLGIGVMQGEDSVNEALSHPGNPPAEAHDLTFFIHCICRDSTDETDPHATSENLMVATVKKAIVNSSTWYTFDSNAVDAVFGATAPFTSPDGELLGATLTLVVTYRISETDPFVVRA